MPDPEHIQLAIDGEVATVTLNRPEKLNALTLDMLDRLAQVAARLDGDRTLRCVIVTGAGDKAFCAGADIRAWSDLKPLDMWRTWIRRGHQVFDQWARLRLPVIAAINGLALGGGLELAAAADIRVAQTGAAFGLPEAGIAAVPGWSGTQRLVTLLGPAHVKLIALTGRRIDPAEAFRIGLIGEPASSDVLARARAIADEIRRMAPVSVQLVKQLVDAGAGAGLASALEGMAGALAASTSDAREGQASFVEKRAPRYRGE